MTSRPLATKLATKRKKNVNETSLTKQIEEDEKRKVVQMSSRSLKRQMMRGNTGDAAALHDDDDDDDEDEEYVIEGKESERIFKLAHEQLDAERGGEEDDDDDVRRPNKRFQAPSSSDRIDEDDDEDEETDDDDEEDEDEDAYNRTRENDYEETLEMTKEEERALELLMGATGDSGKKPRRTLADIIAEKLEQHQATVSTGATTTNNNNNKSRKSMNPQVVEVYTSVGKLLSRYRSGKLPKAFKIVPALRDWEEVLQLTDPAHWTPQATRAATRLFASNLNPKAAQRFYADVLLPKVRDDIAEHKTLNYHFYLSLKKAVYKPAAFFKGIVLPLCEGGDCTLREATILGSVMAKVSVPVLHAGAAMYKIAQMRDYSGASSLFLRVLVNKKYSLPYAVVDALCAHFASFAQKRDMVLPVLFHQALLVFAQRYKGVLSKTQKEALKALMRVHSHPSITPEVRRELFAVAGAKARGAASSSSQPHRRLGRDDDDDDDGAAEEMEL